MSHPPGSMHDPGKRIVRRHPRHASPTNASARQALQRDGDEKPKAPSGWVRWWPLAAGIAISCIAPQLRDLVSGWDPWGMRIVFPYVLLCGRRELGLSDEMTRMLPQIMLFLQFPLEGLLTRFTFSRGIRLPGALLQLLLIHGLGAVVLTLLALPAPN
jgi:hypothetical protein